MARTGRRPGVSGTRRRSWTRPGGSSPSRATSRPPSATWLAWPGSTRPWSTTTGKKHALFVAAVQLPVNPIEQLMGVLAQDPDQAGERMVELFLSVWDHAADQSPLLALVRSAVGDEHAAAMLREFITEEVLGQIAHRLGSPDAKLRATLVGSQIIGMAMARYIVRVEPLASAPAAQVVAAIGPTLQRYLTGDIAAQAARR